MVSIPIGSMNMPFMRGVPVIVSLMFSTSNSFSSSGTYFEFVLHEIRNIILKNIIRQIFFLILIYFLMLYRNYSEILNNVLSCIVEDLIFIFKPYQYDFTLFIYYIQR